MVLRCVRLLLLVCVLGTIAAPSALATPPAHGFGPAIEGWGGYEGQSKCSPYAKPGVLAFRAMVLRAYPGTGAGGIERACNVGGQSEHKEGRAWDWTASAGVPYQRQAAQSLIKWLTDKDRYGNEAAMAKRLGVMYIIWNRRIWGAWGGWETYCVQKPAGCKDPEDGGLRSPHTDHVHISFTWDGAMKRTTYWRKSMSLLAGAEASPYGYWLLGRNGSLFPFNSGFYGHLADGSVKDPVVDMAASPSGWGYYLLSSNGKVKAYGDSRFRGDPKGDTSKAKGIVRTPSGKGYWVFARGGQVFDFGDAEAYGGLGGEGKSVVSMAATPTGLGYWLLTREGQVVPFGDAGSYGGAADEMGNAAGIAATPTGLGYWVFDATGKVMAFGDALDAGDLSDQELTQKIVSLVPTASGLGYWLVGDKGKVKIFGDALKLGSLSSLRSASGPPAGLRPQVLPAD